MAEGISHNLNAHYSTQTKVERPKYTVATPAQNLPSYHIYTDEEANRRLSALNDEINTASNRVRPRRSKKDSKSTALTRVEGNTFDAKKFWTIYLGIVASILGIIGIKKLFK